MRSKDNLVRLQGGELKRETESLNVTTQDQCIKTDMIKTKIGKSLNDLLCRLCKSTSERIDNIVTECSRLAQKEYKKRHDKMGRIVH